MPSPPTTQRVHSAVVVAVVVGRVSRAGLSAGRSLSVCAHTHFSGAQLKIKQQQLEFMELLQ